MKVTKTAPPPKLRKLFFPLLLAGILVVLFLKSFLPDYVHFSNDGPLAVQMAAWIHLPQALTGAWDDLNGVGMNAGAFPLSVNTLVRWALGPIGYAKFLPPVSFFILGIGAWIFFRALKLSPLAAAAGSLATVLNSTCFAAACWGVASQEIALTFVFVALALIASDSAEIQPLARWSRLALAGLCVGLNVMDAADIGALFSVFVALFAVVKTFVDNNCSTIKKIGASICRVAVIAIFAGFIAMQTVYALVGVAVQGVAGSGQQAGDKNAHWDWATQWSLPKVETLGLIVPGVFGYKLDTPNNMYDFLQEAYSGGEYWGGIGRDPVLDRYFDSGSKGPQPPFNFMRQVGGQNYGGIFAALIAAWCISQSFRRKNSLFTEIQRKYIWFWTIILFGSVFLAWGRFTPLDLYRHTIYQLPYFSTMRNPAKFLYFFSIALVVLFAYGVHAMSRFYLTGSTAKFSGFGNWLSKAPTFDRKWIVVCAGLFGASVLAWLIYLSEKTVMVHYLGKVGFDDEETAQSIATFSIHQAAWFLCYFAAAILLSISVIAGFFSGKRARLGGFLIGALLVADLVRADLPFINFWNYKQKYESNPIVDFLREKPYEHRVMDLPFKAAPHLPQYDDYWEQLYRIEWIQQLFPYYNIQSLDMVQNPRPLSDSVAFATALEPSGTSESLYLLTRNWELSNNRYFLGPMVVQLPMGNVDTLDFLNNGLDPKQKRFRIAQRFDIVPKEGVEQIHDLEQLTAMTNDTGGCALFEFTGALPRAKLYTHWETNSSAALKNFTTNGLSATDLAIFDSVGTNDFLTLKKLASPSFDPQQTVLVPDSVPASTAGTNENSVTAEFKSYSPDKIIFATQAAAPTVLLVSSKYDSNWRAWVDGKRTPIFRANFIMRGVYLPDGNHTVTFEFKLPSKPLYVTVAAIVVGLALLGLLFFRHFKSRRG